MNTAKKSAKATQRAEQTLTPIAIIGLAGIMPQAEDLNQYWDNIFNEINCITEVPPSRWSIEDYYNPNPDAPDKSYSKHGGFIPDITFDPMEFGLPPNILEVTDVSQLLSLIVAKKALADSGYGESGTEVRDRTGVILGMVGMASKIIHPLLNRLQYPVWEKVLRASAIPESEIPAIVEKMKLAYIGWNENAFPGAIGNVVAGRIANRLDLGGTNCIVDAACGSSLAAVSAAVNELALGKADMMITGGVDTDNSILTYMCFSKTPAFSKGDRLRAFNAESDGMLTGEGIGMVVMKRLADAERDNDRIYAVIRGIGTSSDGHFKSIYAPRPSGQAKAIWRAYQNAGYSQASVGLIEAHGTGTNAGDPAEFEGLCEAFDGVDDKKQHIALGSVKSQIGHTKATAGAASLIKAALSLSHKVLPATINVSKPNPAMDIKNTPFYLNTETRPWFRNDANTPRRAGVSSFGFGGTNFHIALEEYTGKTENMKEGYRLQQVPFTVLLSAISEDALIKICGETMEKLQSEQGETLLNQLDWQAADAEIPADHARLGFVTDSVSDAVEKLGECAKLFAANQGEAAWSHPKGIFYRQKGMDPKGKTVALFPGQGSQYLNMGRELAINFPPVREAFEQANAVIADKDREALTRVVYPIPVFSDEERKEQTQRLTQTENAQPAIGTFSLALYKLLQSAGFKADFFAGHSFGELTALWASGVYDDKAFLRLAKARGEAMSQPADSDKDAGSMAAVKGDVAKVQELLKDQADITIANFNSTSQVVLAGSTEAIKAIQPKLEEAGLSVYPLSVSAAFHTAFVKHAQAPFEKAIEKETFQAPKGKVFSNSSAQAYAKDAQKIRKVLAGHILNSVRFKEEIENIYTEGGSIFVEIGPKNVLTNLVKDILQDKPHETITLNPNARGDSDSQLRQAVVQMRVLGFQLGNTDPYRKYRDAAKPEYSKVAVSLNGGLYTSEKTRSAFERALAEKPQRAPQPATIPSSPSAPAPAASVSPTPDNTAAARPLEIQKMTKPSPHNAALIDRFQEFQKDFLKAHEQYLQNDSASKQILQDITQSQMALITQLRANPQLPNVDQTLALLSKQAEMVNNQQAATSQAHQAYIQSQTAFSQQYMTLLQELIASGETLAAPVQTQPVEAVQPAPVVTETVKTASIPAAQPQAAPAAVPAAAYDASELQDAFLAIVSDKTGYPTDMLELGMDMEADLGIDSIKRVEILGAMQEQYPDLPTIEAEELSMLRTLEHIIASFNNNSATLPQGDARDRQTQGSPSDKAQPTSAPAATAQTPAESPATASTSYDVSELQGAFLAIVSDKTGYPTDMLELGMDMEADLGIDSIKRVEILGAMQEQYPDLPTIEAEELSMLRTLEQIIASFNKDRAIPEPVEGALHSNKAQPASIPAAAAQTPVENPATASTAYDASELQSAFLAIVSDKTGYPTDMLELGMDMEADLGIDSIKRVEILGAMQEQYPDLPAIEAEELSVLRTLEQIIASFSQTPQAKKTPVQAEPVKDEIPAVETSKIERFPVKLKQLPKPDRLEFELPKDGLVIITDDGTEKAKLLAESYLEQGQKVALVQFNSNGKTNNGNLPKEVRKISIPSADEKEIQTKMEALISEQDKLAAFIHLNPAANGRKKSLLDIPDEENEILKSVFLMARHLKKALTVDGADYRPTFLTVTQMDGQFGLNGNLASDPLPGGFAGLAKTLRLEWPNVFCRALDLHADMDAKVAITLIQDELHDPDLHIAEVGYTPAGRFTLALDEK